MKAELNIKETANVKHTFPALYQAIRSDGKDDVGFIVLATGEDVGFQVLGSGKLGEFDGRWIEFTDPKEWRRLPAGTTITLTQE